MLSPLAWKRSLRPAEPLAGGEPLPPLARRSSREDAQATGWATPGVARGAYVDASRHPVLPRPFGWLRPRVLLETRNHVLTALVRAADTDIVNDERQRWLASQRSSGALDRFPRLEVNRRELGSFSFLVVGDPGEADASQYAVVPHLLARGRDTSFMVVMSDVVYPTGEANDYVDAFYRPYRAYQQPIYAVPGNHDWYSLLSGFMWTFCGAEPPPEPTYRLSSYSWQERLARFLWLRPRAPLRSLLDPYRHERWGSGDPLQPGPYFAIETPHLRIVCIDTGTSGTIDREQGEWLAAISADDKPKLLLTGKPHYADNRYHPCRIEWEPAFTTDRHPERTGVGLPRRLADDERVAHPPFATVDDLVRDPGRNFVAVIGGDVHNYQRYPVRVPGEDGATRTIQYVVSGGGGAFASPTHVIEPVTPDGPAGITEDELRLYPLRGDSLARFSRAATWRLRRSFLELLAATVVLAYVAVLAWNPPHGTMRGWVVAGIPVGRALNPQRNELLGVAVLGWIAGHDYDTDITRAVAIIALSIGAAAALLPWFRLRARAVIVFVALVAAGYLWGAIGTPAFAAAALVASVAPLVLTRERVRETSGSLLVALAVALLVVGAVIPDLTSSNAGRFLAALAAFSAVAVLLVGGPPASLRSASLASAAILVVAVLVWTIEAGYFWIVLAAIAALAAGATAYVAVVLRWALVAGRRADGDAGARHIAGLTGCEPERSSARTSAGRPERRVERTLQELLPEPGGRRRLLLYAGAALYAALLDHDEQPFFKSFLRVDAGSDGVELVLYGVTSEDAPTTIEDHARWDPDRGWCTARAALGLPDRDTVSGSVDLYAGAEWVELVFDLPGEEPGTPLWCHLRADDAAPWREPERFSYGDVVRVPRSEAPPRGWFRQVGLSPGEQPPPAEPSLVAGTMI